MNGDALPLPAITLNGASITRLIAGGNPFRGYSHFSPELDAEMKEYHTRDNIVKALFECEKQGINAMVSRGDKVVFDAVRAYRESGGAMHWIAQTASEHPDVFRNIREIAALYPLAIYFHGSETDRLWKSGQADSIRDKLKAIRDTGAAVGLSSHMPEVFRYVEDCEWDIDFYMTCFYNISKIERGSMLAGAPRVDEPFDDDDRDIICEFIRSTSKTCLAFKILGAGRHADTPARLKSAFHFALERIKPGDALVVGMFQKHGNQAAENARIMREWSVQYNPRNEKTP